MRAALARADRLPLWALFPGSKLGESPAHPTLGEMAAKAIELAAAEAKRRGHGFFLLLEEEGIDTAGHARDLEAMARAVLHLDQAVEAAVALRRRATARRWFWSPPTTRPAGWSSTPTRPRAS